MFKCRRQLGCLYLPLHSTRKVLGTQQIFDSKSTSPKSIPIDNRQQRELRHDHHSKIYLPTTFGVYLTTLEVEQELIHLHTQHNTLRLRTK